MEELLGVDEQEQESLSSADADKKEEDISYSPKIGPKNQQHPSDLLPAVHAILDQEKESLYDCACNANIYNAFLIATYRKKDLQWKQANFIQRDMKYGLGCLAYLTSFVQWIALLTLLLALFDKTAQTVTGEALTHWSAWPSDWATLAIWPFFMIGLYSTYKHFSQIWVDIYVLRQWGIKADRKHCHVFYFKYISELILYTGGSFLFYVVLSLYNQADNDFLDVILKLLSYQFIFDADEWAYQLLQDIVKRRIHPDHLLRSKKKKCHYLFGGQRLGRAYKFEMLIYITIPFSMSIIIQGIFSQSYMLCLIGCVSTIIWALDSLEQRCCKNEIYW